MINRELNLYTALTEKMYISNKQDLGKVTRIRIVLLTPFYHPIIGGITSFVSNLQKSLSKKRVAVSIITGRGRRSNEVEVIGSNKYLYVAKAIISIRRKKPDVLHSHGHWYVLLPCVLYRTFHPKIRLIHTFHTEPMKRSIGLRKKVFEHLLSKCDYVTFVSHNLMSKFEEKFTVKSEKRVVYAGVIGEESIKEDVKNFVNDYNLKDMYPILLFIGPLSWKMKAEGVKRLIEAFVIVKKNYPNAKLLIVGDGSYRIELDRFTEKNKMTSEVIFTGFLESAFVPLSIADIYTHISLQETLSISVLEAMIMGKPIIAANTGGIPELITDGENGILVEPKPHEIAESIIKLCNDEKRMEALGKNAQKKAKERHNWDDIALKFVNLYKGKNGD